MKKAIYYINQFFGGVGGENDADFEPVIKDGPVGPGVGLQAALKDVAITHTIICGDNFMASHKDEALKRIWQEHEWIYAQCLVHEGAAGVPWDKR